jgi:hypothetical protein
MPPAIKLNIVERSYDLSNNLENYTDWKKFYHLVSYVNRDRVCNLRICKTNIYIHVYFWHPKENKFYFGTNMIENMSYNHFCPPPFRRKKGDIEIGSVRTSVRPSHFRVRSITLSFSKGI